MGGLLREGIDAHRLRYCLPSGVCPHASAPAQSAAPEALMPPSAVLPASTCTGREAVAPAATHEQKALVALSQAPSCPLGPALRVAFCGAQ